MLAQLYISTQRVFPKAMSSDLGFLTVGDSATNGVDYQHRCCPKPMQKDGTPFGYSFVSRA